MLQYPHRRKCRHCSGNLAHQSIDLIICDQRMPGKTGVEFLEQISGTHPDVIRMILTGY
ncbi:MAG: response regulator, partial [Saprospiraceae bacterium]|nr:response regulator [Saprospiraceae bacterium]